MLPIVSKANNLVNKGAFWTKQHAPQLMIAGGVLGELAAMGFMIWATLKVQEPLGEAQAELEAIEDTKKKFDDYSDEAAKKDRRKVYRKFAGKAIKLYAPGAGIAIASSALILGGAGVLNKRYTNTVLGLASATAGFKDYRKNVIAKYGEDVDKELRYGLKEVEIKEQITDENGKTKTVKKKILIAENEKSDKDEYCRTFDCSNPYYQAENTYNMIFINAQQSYFNDMLRINGHVFLNDVLLALGFKSTRAGQEVGWNYKGDEGDGYIDFRAQAIRIPMRKITKNGDEIIEYKDAVALDFNVDGSIINKVEWKE